MPKVRALGAHCTPKYVFFALVEGGVVLKVGPERVEIPDGLKTAASLKVLSEDLHRRLVETGATHGALLQPMSYDSGVNPTVSRVGAETLLRWSAAEVGIEVELLNRATARSRMKIPRAGHLEDRIAELLPQPVGHYWEWRRYAAFAAFACEQRAG
jgi:hypothetical protein